MTRSLLEALALQLQDDDDNTASPPPHARLLRARGHLQNSAALNVGPIQYRSLMHTIQGMLVHASSERRRTDGLAGVTVTVWRAVES